MLSVVFQKHVRAMTSTAMLTGALLALPLSAGICLQTLGIKHSPASQCAFIAGMCVVIVPVLKIILYRTFAPVKVWIAATTVIAGLFVIAVKRDFSVSVGDLYTITGATAFALCLIKVEKYAKVLNIVTTIVPMFAACALLTGCLALLDNTTVWMQQSNVSGAESFIVRYFPLHLCTQYPISPSDMSVLDIPEHVGLFVNFGEKYL